MKNLKIIWTLQAIDDLKNIYNFWKKKSLHGANNVRSDIIRSPKTIYFSEQYQIDDINLKYRRIIVRDNYKVLYKIKNDAIYIVGIVSTFQSPNIIKDK